MKYLQSPLPTSQENQVSISLFVKSLESSLRRFSGHHLATAKQRINDVIFHFEMECYDPRSLSTPTAASSSLPLGFVNGFNPQSPAATLNTDNCKWSFQ